MLGFWLIAGAMTLVAVAFVAARLVVPRRSPFHAEPRDANLAVLRASWSELDRDCATGLLPADQRESARAELATRAAEELEEPRPAASPRPDRTAAALAAILIPLAAFGVYRLVGSPESVDNVRAFASLDRPMSPENLPAFRERLEKHLADNPRDGRAWVILGRVDLALERHASAAAAFAEAVESSRKVAGDPEVWIDYAEAVGMAEGRTLVGRPERLIAKALEIDPSNARALEMAGSLATERGDHAGAARHWTLMRDRLDADDPRRVELSRAIARAGRIAVPGGMTKP